MSVKTFFVNQSFLHEHNTFRGKNETRKTFLDKCSGKFSGKLHRIFFPKIRPDNLSGNLFQATFPDNSLDTCSGSLSGKISRNTFPEAFL